MREFLFFLGIIEYWKMGNSEGMEKREQDVLEVEKMEGQDKSKGLVV